MQRILFLLGDFVEDFDFFGLNALLYKCRDYAELEIDCVGAAFSVLSNNGFTIAVRPVWEWDDKQYHAIIIPGAKNYDSLTAYRDALARRFQYNILSGCRVYTICSGAKLLGELGMLEGFRISVHKEKWAEYVRYKAIAGVGVERHSWLTSVGPHTDYQYVKSIECFFQVIQDLLPASCMQNIIRRAEIRPMSGVLWHEQEPASGQDGNAFTAATR